MFALKILMLVGIRLIFINVIKIISTMNAKTYFIDYFRM